MSQELIAAAAASSLVLIFFGAFGRTLMPKKGPVNEFWFALLSVGTVTYCITWFLALIFHMDDQVAKNFFLWLTMVLLIGVFFLVIIRMHLENVENKKAPKLFFRGSVINNRMFFQTDLGYDVNSGTFQIRIGESVESAMVPDGYIVETTFCVYKKAKA